MNNYEIFATYIYFSITSSKLLQNAGMAVIFSYGNYLMEYEFPASAPGSWRTDINRPVLLPSGTRNFSGETLFGVVRWHH
jgi:hypothetical protein